MAYFEVIEASGSLCVWSHTDIGTYIHFLSVCVRAHSTQFDIIQMWVRSFACCS